METQNITSRHLLGAHQADPGVRFSVWAPHAEAVYLTGSFCDWEETAYPMNAADPGYWELELPNVKNGDEYQFIIETPEGERLWRNDPYARKLTNSSGNSIVYLEDYDWEGDDFHIGEWNELLIYEMHIGTFHVEEEGRPGTFASAIKKLPYLQELGINAVELMPVNEFAGDYSWGYNPAFPYSVEEAYGGPTGLKDFVKAAHRHGIAVILDVVYNHFGPSDLGLWQFDGWHQNGKGGIYFYNDWRSSTPWGDTRPDYGRPEVRQYICDNALMWLEDYHCDGLRMDMIPYIRHVSGMGGDDDRIDEGFELMKWINDEINQRFAHKITIAEDLHGHDYVTDPTQGGGLGFGTQWDADFVHPVREQLILAEDSHRDIYRISHALLRQYSGDPSRRVIYTESHDEVANGKARLPEEVADDVNSYYSKKKSALGALLVMTAPGIPMLFQGQELLEDRWFSDQDPIDWSRLEGFNGIYLLYRDLIALRRNKGGNSRGLLGRNIQIVHANQDDKVIAFHRWYDTSEEDGVFIVINFSNNIYSNYRIGLPAGGEWELRFNSDWKGYDESFDEAFSGHIDPVAESYDDQPCSADFDLAPYAGYIYTRSGK